MSEIVTGDHDKPVRRIPSRLKSNARALRKNSTDTERLLWSKLRNHRLNGASFRRQVPIENYIADFVCHTAKLVIEIDGGQHFSDVGERADAARTTVIERGGFRVLRFSNHDVMTNCMGVLETIVAALGSCAYTQVSAPSPTLPRKRERGQAEACGSDDDNTRAEAGTTKGIRP